MGVSQGRGFVVRVFVFLILSRWRLLGGMWCYMGGLCCYRGDAVLYGACGVVWGMWCYMGRVVLL